MGGAVMVTGQLSLSPVVVLAAGEACGAVTDGAPVHPQGQGVGNSRRKSATKERRREIPAPPAPTKEGLDRPERTRTIRQDSSQNVVDRTGPGGPELCDGTPGPQQPAAPADAHSRVSSANMHFHQGKRRGKPASQFWRA